MLWQESDWGLHAQRGGKITTAAALVFMVVSFVFWAVLGAFWSLAVALFLATFEAPVVYKCLEVCVCVCVFVVAMLFLFLFFVPPHRCWTKGY